MNEWNGIGRLTHDLELREVGDGLKVVNFQLAVDDPFDDEHTDFFRCVAWNKTAEIMATYLGKGSLISISGRLKSGRYEDENGKMVYTTDIVVRQMGMLETKRMREAREKNTQTSNQQGYGSFGTTPTQTPPTPAQNTPTSQPSHNAFDDEMPELDITSDDLPF